MQKVYVPSQRLQKELQQFITSHDVALLNQDMRRQFMDYLDYQLATGVPLYFDSFLFAYNCLFDLLDIIAKDKAEFEQEENKPPMAMGQTTKEKVIQFLLTSLSPEKIYLLCEETGINNTAYFDLLVVIPETAQTAFSHYEQVISMANIDHAAIHVSLHKSIFLQQQLEAGHIFYSLTCTKENLVYDDKTVAFPEIKPRMLKTLTENASNEFNVSHRRAESFLEGASDYYGRHEEEMATFMLQQAIELNIRGLIKALSGNCAKTHCFGELKKPLKRYIPELRYILSEDEDEENRLLRILEKAYLEARYSTDFSISDNDFTLITEAAEHLHKKAEEIFKCKMEGLNKTAFAE